MVILLLDHVCAWPQIRVLLKERQAILGECDQLLRHPDNDACHPTDREELVVTVAHARDGATRVQVGIQQEAPQDHQVRDGRTNTTSLLDS